MRKFFYVFILLLAAGSAYFFIYHISPDSASVAGVSVTSSTEEIATTTIEMKDRAVKVEIHEGETYDKLLKGAGVDYALAMEIWNAAKPVYDLAKVRAGASIDLIFDNDSSELRELVYQIDTEQKLYIHRQNQDNAASSTQDVKGKWRAELKTIEYEIRRRVVSGTVESSLYQSAIDSNIDIRAIIDLADIFQWTIDFAMDPRAGDTYKFIIEDRYLDGQYVMPGRIWAGEYINDGQRYSAYYFEESAENKGYFDQDGNLTQKMFLKAPVAFKYISSGYTKGPRYVAEFKTYNKSHMAIDYAAAMGTPIRAVGDGTIVSAAYSRVGYGNLVQVKHNATYSTNYGHLSKFAVRKGQKVKQGDIIGYVGNTGFSTGPHLHYEMVKDGVKINPLKEVTPPGKPILPENKERFQQEIYKYDEEMK